MSQYSTALKNNDYEERERIVDKMDKILDPKIQAYVKATGGGDWKRGMEVRDEQMIRSLEEFEDKYKSYIYMHK